MVTLTLVRFVFVVLAVLLTCVFIEASVVYDAAARAGLSMGTPSPTVGGMFARWMLAAVFWTAALSVPHKPSTEQSAKRQE